MTELINGRTPEEIKLALELCNMISNRKNICESCPYNGECTPKDKPDQPGWDALLYIQRLEAAQPKWISVKERLPEKLIENNQAYLTEQVIGFDGERVYLGQFKVYKFNERRTFFDGEYFRDDIVCWMPLPEPPEEERK